MKKKPKNIREPGQACSFPRRRLQMFPSCVYFHSDLMSKCCCVCFVPREPRSLGVCCYCDSFFSLVSPWQLQSENNLDKHRRWIQTSLELQGRLFTGERLLLRPKTNRHSPCLHHVIELHQKFDNSMFFSHTYFSETFKQQQQQQQHPLGQVFLMDHI